MAMHLHHPTASRLWGRAVGKERRDSARCPGQREGKEQKPEPPSLPLRQKFHSGLSCDDFQEPCLLSQNSASKFQVMAFVTITLEVRSLHSSHLLPSASCSVFILARQRGPTDRRQGPEPRRGKEAQTRVSGDHSLDLF